MGAPLSKPSKWSPIHRDYLRRIQRTRHAEATQQPIAINHLTPITCIDLWKSTWPSRTQDRQNDTTASPTGVANFPGKNTTSTQIPIALSALQVPYSITQVFQLLLKAQKDHELTRDLSGPKKQHNYDRVELRSISRLTRECWRHLFMNGRTEL